MHELTDNALMLNVKSGDLGKLGLLYERHKKRLFGFFYNLNGNATVSEDLVQNVFVRMLKYRHTYSGEGSFMAWMFSTARNVHHDHFKKQGSQWHYDIDSMGHKVEAYDNLEETSDLQDAVSILKRAMSKLAPEKREILLLSKFKAMKFSEIGTLLGCSEGTAKVKAHRALKELKTIYMQLDIQ